jgi:hypothetical protein
MLSPLLLHDDEVAAERELVGWYRAGLAGRRENQSARASISRGTQGARDLQALCERVKHICEAPRTAREGVRKCAASEPKEAWERRLRSGLSVI